MSSSRPLKIHTPTRTESDPVFGEVVPRLILALDGEILFTNPTFEDMADAPMLRGQNFLKIAEFIDTEEAFRNAPLLFAQENTIMSALRSGLHEISFRKNGQRLSLQFDSVMTRKGEQYIIASGLEYDDEFTRSFEELVAPSVATPDDVLLHFLDLSSDVLMLSRKDGAFEHINDRFTDILGFTLSDLEGRSFLDLVHPDDRAGVRASMQALQRGETSGNVIDFECRLISNEARSYSMEWKHKLVAGKIYSAGRDITAIKKHEQQLIKRAQQLSEAEAIGHMGHWHWTIGEQELSFSDEIYRIFGVASGKFQPTLDSVNAMLHRRDAGRMEQAFQRAVIEQNDHEIDFRVITPTGEVRHVRCQGRCEFDSEGDVSGLYGIMQDVTQAMNHERALREAKESAERAYAAKSQFLANMSHELRTPLNAIIGFSEMMQQQLLGPIGNDRYLDYIKGINESGEHLLDLITDILDMSKIEAGKYTLDTEDLNVTKTIRLAVHMVEGRAMDQGIKIKIHVPADDIHIVADRRAVTQMILNLLSNAVKFSHRDGIVDIEAVVQHGHLSLRVKDHGIGIPANKLPTITNPFEQAANQYTRSHEGSGLGLSITKELAELHGGGIHIESTVNVGTTVTIRLPLTAIQKT
ncbi:MAG: PAS domain-containing sensor histidine kinase [Micavibrio aeruginosavorus]|uniref:histidine kinase n=1 Tax=Micavibrio aeruginosavorus TaxID=349221 RepID=A0A2W5N6R4_9BACT|nr:MAG: PAS domain-containing sensor histidine kinase [Micavibrio aeruginosavorus]